MKKLIPLLILSTFFLSSCSEPDSWALHQAKSAAVPVLEPVPVDFIPRKLTILAAGDSLTEGVGDSSGSGGYLPYLKTMLEQEKGITEVDFYNYGVKGNRTTQLIKRLQTKEMKTLLKQTDVVILTIGGNDIMKVVRDNISNLEMSIFMKEKNSYRKHLTEIFEMITQENPNVSIVLVGLYNPFFKWFSDIEEMDEIVFEWNKTGQSVVANYPNAYFVEIEDLFINANENLLYTDNFHPNDQGYEYIAEKVNETLDTQVIPDLDKRSYLVSTEEN